MSSGIEAFDRNSQAYAEKFFWPLISNAGAFVKEQHFPCFVADSTAIRAHVGLARDVGDIDFVFAPTCDGFCTVNAAVHALKPIDREIAKGPNGEILFARLKLPLEIAYRQERSFIVDLHFGGLVYKGNYSWRPALADVFQLAEWMPVNDLSGNLTAELPVHHRSAGRNHYEYNAHDLWSSPWHHSRIAMARAPETVCAAYWHCGNYR